MKNKSKKIVKSVVNEKIKKKEMFTALDVTNEIRKQGIWIDNHMVSGFLKSKFKKPKEKYNASVIKVFKESGEEVDALLYHNNKSDISKYDINKKIINKEEFVKIVDKKIKILIKQLKNIKW